MSGKLQRISVIDSHTGGEPTRVVIDGGPDLGGGSASRSDAHSKIEARLAAHRGHQRAARVGSVGRCAALPAGRSQLYCGSHFFQQRRLHRHVRPRHDWHHDHARALGPHSSRARTASGNAASAWSAPRCTKMARCRCRMCPATAKRRTLLIDVPGVGAISGDVAWGGNWFYLVEKHGQFADRHCERRKADRGDMANPPGRSTPAAIRKSITSSCSARRPCRTPHSRNFVLCPGKALRPLRLAAPAPARSWPAWRPTASCPKAKTWVQESIVGSTFTGRYRWLDRAAGTIEPTIRGQAFITGETVLVLDDADPFRNGFAGPTL